MTEDKKEPKATKQDNAEKTIVVEQLPTYPSNRIADEKTGEEFSLVTRDEALTEILDKVRRLAKALI